MKPAPTRRRWLFALGAVVTLLLAVAIVTLLLRDVIRTTVGLRFGYLAWLAGLVINSVPQSIYWTMVVAATILLALNILNTKSVQALLRRTSSTVPALVDSQELSTLAQWRNYIERIGESNFARERIAFELRVLIIQVLAHRERQPVENIEQRIRRDGVASLPPMPPDVQELLQNWQLWLEEPVAHGVLQRLRDEALLALYPQAPRVTRFEQRLASGVEYMESLLNSPVLDTRIRGEG